MIGTQICINAADCHVHLCQFPSVGVCFLTIHGNATTIAAVGFDKLSTLDEHTTAAAARIVHTTVAEGLQNLDNGLYHAGGGVEFGSVPNSV